MMWQQVDMRFPDNMGAVICSMVPVHPWIYGTGQKTATGSYLSPANALEYLASRIQTVNTERHVTILMVCAASYGEFMQRLLALTAILPLPVLTQVARIAQATRDLDTDKMQLPAKSSLLPDAVPLSIVTSRQALNAQRIAAAQAQAAVSSGVEGIKGQLASFSATRDNLLTQINQGVGELQQACARAWVFSAKGQGGVVATQMVKDIPQPSAVYTVAVMFVGDSLNALEGMINEPDYYARPQW